MSQLNLIGQSLLPVTMVTRNSYNKSIIAILGSGNAGKYSVLDLGIVPPFGRADTVDLERNISLVFQSCNKTLGRERDPRANGAWLNKLTE